MSWFEHAVVQDLPADLAATQLSADQNAPFGIGAVDLKHALGKVKTNNTNVHRTAPSVVAIFLTTTVGHFDAGQQGPSTPSK